VDHLGAPQEPPELEPAGLALAGDDRSLAHPQLARLPQERLDQLIRWPGGPPPQPPGAAHPAAAPQRLHGVSGGPQGPDYPGALGVGLRQARFVV